jgi:Flp pilus assembly pilin Flp
MASRIRDRRRTVGRSRDETGQGLVEYALIIAVVSLAAVAALGFLSGEINDLFSRSGNTLESGTLAVGSGGPGGPGGGDPPAAPTIASGPTNWTSSSNASFTFSSAQAGVGFECKVDGGGFTACTSPFAQGGLSGGAHSFSVRATAGGTPGSPATFSWSIWGPPPADGTVITLGGAGYVWFNGGGNGSGNPDGRNGAPNDVSALYSTTDNLSGACNVGGGSFTGTWRPTNWWEGGWYWTFAGDSSTYRSACF